MDHKYYKYVGYENYNLKGVALDQAYLSWNKTNDSKIKNPNFNWYDIFDAEPYLTRLSLVSEGYAFIQMQIASKRFTKNFHEERHKRYNEYIKSLKLGEDTPPMILASLDGLFKQIYRQLQNQIDEMERIDTDIQRVLKVYLYECEQQIQPTEENKGDLFQMINDIRRLYQVGIRVLCMPDLLADKWLPKRMNRQYVPAPIAKSTTAGILHLCRKKEKVLIQAVPLFEKLLHLENLKYYALNDMPIVTDDERDMPKLIDEKIESATNETQKGMFKKEKANYMYLPQIHSLIDENPSFTNKQIRIKLKPIKDTSKPSLSTIQRRKREYLEGK